MNMTLHSVDNLKIATIGLGHLDFPLAEKHSCLMRDQHAGKFGRGFAWQAVWPLLKPVSVSNPN